MASKALIANTSEIDIAYREFGDPAGLPVLFLHGFPYASEGWDELLERLDPVKRNLRCIVPAMRGYGETHVKRDELVSGQTAAFAADVFALADALHIDRFVIVGHDWGARAGYAASVLAPERILAHFALGSPYYMTGAEDAMPPAQVEAYWYQWYFQTSMGEKVLHENLDALCKHIWRRWSPSWKFSSREFKQAAESWRNPQFVRVTLSSYRHRYGNALGRPAYADAQTMLDAKPKPSISVPTTFVYGTEDGCILAGSSEEQHKYFTGPYERVAIKGAGHIPHQEDPRAVTKLLQRFLDDIQRR